MNPDDEICCCCHVSARKLLHFARRTKPLRPSQMSECLGAGTGCGWCIPFLKKIAVEGGFLAIDELTADEYAAQRAAYLEADRPKNTF